MQTYLPYVALMHLNVRANSDKTRSQIYSQKFNKLTFLNTVMVIPQTSAYFFAHRTLEQNCL